MYTYVTNYLNKKNQRFFFIERAFLMLLNIEQINLQSMFLCKEIRLSKKNTLSVTRVWKRCMNMVVYIRYQARVTYENLPNNYTLS